MGSRNNGYAENSLNDVEKGALIPPSSESSLKTQMELKRVSSSGSIGSSAVKTPKPKSTIMRPSMSVLAAVGLYTFCSVGMVLVNKSLASG